MPSLKLDRKLIALQQAIIFNCPVRQFNAGDKSMGKIESISILLTICLAWLGSAAAQGMGDTRAYDQSGYQGMGTQDYDTEQAVMVMPDYLNPYGSAWQEADQSYNAGAVSARLMMEQADPAAEGLVHDEKQSLANQLYLQMGRQMLTEGMAVLGEDYILWAKIGTGGGFQLFDYNSLVLSQVSVTPGWYRISGAYGNYPGGHLYRFQAAGLSSNNLTVEISSGDYPTAYSLTGRVVDQEGRGLAGARVVLINGDGGRFSAISDESGYYALDVAAGGYGISAEHPGYAFTSGQVEALPGLISAARPLVGTPLSGPSESRAGSLLPPIFS